MYNPSYESGEVVDDGDLAFTDDGLETPERYVGFEGVLVVVAPDVRRHVRPVDAVTEDTSLLECYPAAAEWFQEPYCDDDTVLIHPKGAAVAHRYRVADERRDPVERGRKTPSSA
ncbi:hypothetical protein [Haloterrigena salifodinae]|uniref:hypothetical protein n=1 Tax=Haloterrigena salifodinae TaxID=2675099 RepID=UPI000F896490|nr:hypothetical protein [Haloterrigena salifodinae]